MPYNPVQETSLLTNEQMGLPNYGEAIKQGMLGAQLSSETAIKPRELAEKLLNSHLMNKQQQILNQFLPQSEGARIAATQAGTESTLQDVLRNKILNQYLPEHEQATIGNLKALTQNRSSGLSGQGGVALKEERNLINQVALDNPDLNEDQLRQAADSYAMGDVALPDGTALAPISPTTRRALDRLALKSTTSALATKGVQASQSEREIEEGSRYIQSLAQPYGTTYLGISPEQVVDSFGHDKASQERMGRYMGIQALQYELAQIRNRLAGGEPGISATNELLGHSGQIIENYAPRVTGEARREAERVINEGITKMAAARREAGTSPSMLGQKIKAGKTPLEGYEDLSSTTQPGGIHFGDTYDYKTGEWK